MNSLVGGLETAGVIVGARTLDLPRISQALRGQRGLIGVGFKLTDSGDYDRDNKQLKNWKNPTDDQDACPKSYADKTRPMTGTLDMQDNEIIKVANPSNNKDAVNKQYVESHFLKTSGGDVSGNIVFINNSKSLRHITGLSDNPLSGTAAVNLNKLSSELQTKADLSVVTNGLNAKLDKTTFNTEIAKKLDSTRLNAEMVKKADKNYVILLDGSQAMTEQRVFKYIFSWTLNDEPSSTTNGRKLETRSGSEVTKNYTTTKNLQVRQRRLLDMPRSFSDDNEVITKKYADDKAVSEAHKCLPLDGSRSMTGDLNLNNKKAINSAAPTTGTDFCNKTYVDTELAKKHDIGSVDLSDYRDKTKGVDIEKPLNFTSIHGADRQISGISDQPLNGTSVVNANKLQSELVKTADLRTMSNELDGKLDKTTFNTEIAKKSNSSKVLLLDGTRAMTGNLNMNSKSITNLKDPQPEESLNVSTVNYVNKTISDNNAFMKTNYEIYFDDHISRGVSSRLKNDLRTLFSNPIESLQNGTFKGVPTNVQLLISCKRLRKILPEAHGPLIQCAPSPLTYSLCGGGAVEAVLRGLMGSKCSQTTKLKPNATCYKCSFCSTGTRGTFRSCLNCPKGGFYQDEMGQTECKNCSTGTYVPEKHYPGKSATDCRACPY
ncbi:hypothetical protein AWC38_SpisGene24497, partial [Stylophora pistillata]